VLSLGLHEKQNRIIKVPYHESILHSICITGKAVNSFSRPYFFFKFYTDFLAADPEVPGSIPGTARFSE
jgi:hypothetical protein